MGSPTSSLSLPWAMELTFNLAPANARLRITVTSPDGALRSVHERPVPPGASVQGMSFIGFPPGSTAVLELLAPGGAALSTSTLTKGAP